jgi:hypothetical protein
MAPPCSCWASRSWTFVQCNAKGNSLCGGLATCRLLLGMHDLNRTPRSMASGTSQASYSQPRCHLEIREGEGAFLGANHCKSKIAGKERLDSPIPRRCRLTESTTFRRASNYVLASIYVWGIFPRELPASVHLHRVSAIWRMNDTEMNYVPKRARRGP